MKYSALGEEMFNKMKSTYIEYMENILGLIEEVPEDTEKFLNPLIELYRDAKYNRQFDKVDKIRADLKNSGIILKDMKNGVDWAYEE
jgi:cysteinyl-tRNA synthetase